MLDIDLFRESKGNDPQKIRESQRKRSARLDVVDEIIRLDLELTILEFELDLLVKHKYRIFKEVTKRIKPGGKFLSSSDRISEINELLGSIAKTDAEVQKVRAALSSNLKLVGNLVHETVPVSNDEANNAVVRTWGEKRTEPKPKNHVELVELLEIADPERGAKAAGKGGFFLKDDGVDLNQALINFGLDFLENKGFTPFQTPSFMTKNNMGKFAQSAQFDEKLYRVTDEGDDKYLIATAEHALHGYPIIPPEQLPLQYAWYSSCFQKEAGSHGRDTLRLFDASEVEKVEQLCISSPNGNDSWDMHEKMIKNSEEFYQLDTLGLFDASEVEKVEQLCITSPNGNDSWDMHEKMIKNSEEFYQLLKLPYRIVSVVSGALNVGATKKYGLEAWFPASNNYRELASCSNCTDYQSRKLEIRLGHTKNNLPTEQYCHLLNSTLTTVERTMCCILENYQREDGVEVPEVLQPYVDGKKFMPFKAPLSLGLIFQDTTLQFDFFIGLTQSTERKNEGGNMLDNNPCRIEKGNNPEIIRESQRRRFANVEIVDEIIPLYKEWQQRQVELERLVKALNNIKIEVAQQISIAGEDPRLIFRHAEVKEATNSAQNKIVEVQEARAAYYSKLELVGIGNLVHYSVPVSNDEANNVVVRTWGEKRKDPKLKSHVELVELLGIADLQEGANVAGGRGCYLKGAGVHLNRALIKFGRNFLKSKGFRSLKTPLFMTKDIMGKCAQLGQFDEDLYKVTGEGDDKYLIATAEQPLCGYHIDDWIHPTQLPLRYAGYSSCFPKEAGSHGCDTPGIFRLHQFEKVEQFCITSPNGNDSWDMHEEMLKNSEEFYQMLKLPYRIVSVVSGALNVGAAKKYDLEAWFPASNTYRELASCSNCTDYPSRKLNIRFGLEEYCHLLNSTLTATERTICCILENYQREDGVEVPQVLQPFMNGKNFMRFQPVNKTEGERY